MPIFSRAAERPDQPPVWTARAQAYESPVGRPDQPGPAVALYQPPARVHLRHLRHLRHPRRPRCTPGTSGEGSLLDLLRAEPSRRSVRRVLTATNSFVRLFPDYPRPAVWPDGYYVPSSTGDEVIEKHACVVERSAMLAGRAAREQCFVINDVNFLNNADLDGTELPPRGAPNVMMAAGGAQLKKVFEDDAILAWKFFTDWSNPSTQDSGRQRGILRSGQGRDSRALSASRSRRITICATVSSPTACRSLASNDGSTRRATRSWRGSSIAASAISSRSSASTRSTRPRMAAVFAGMNSESMIEQGETIPARHLRTLRTVRTVRTQL